MQSLLAALKNPTTQLRILLFSIVVFWLNSIHDGVVNIDTPWLVCTNPLLSNPQLSSWPTIWTDLSFSTRQILGAEYLPIRDLSVWLDFAIFGEWWAGHHLTNLILYGVGVILFWRILSVLFDTPVRILLGTLFFALHPTHIESVVWLASRKDVLSLVWVMAAVLALLQRRSIWLITALSLLAYWSKNTAISLAPILFVAAFVIRKDNPQKIRWWIQWLPIAVVFGFGLMITFKVGGMMHMFAPSRAETTLDTLTITAQVWTQYAHMLIWPSELSLLYVEPEVEPLSNIRVLFGLTLILSCILTPVLTYRRFPAVAFGMAWIGFSLLPVSQVSPIQNLMADRYLLLPSAGFAIVLTSCWPNRFRLTPPLYIVALGALTMLRLPIWHSSETLWTDVTEKQPLEPRGWAALSGVYQDAGDLIMARQVTEKGIRLVNAPILHQSLGLIDLKEGDLRQAKIELTHAWTQDKQLRKSGNNLALVYHRLGDLNTAAQIAKEVSENHPLYATGWNTKGAIALDLGDLDSAQSDFESALRCDPYLVSAIANLGNVAYQRKDYTEARSRWRQVLELDPSHDHAQRGIHHLDSMEHP